MISSWNSLKLEGDDFVVDGHLSMMTAHGVEAYARSHSEKGAMILAIAKWLHSVKLYNDEDWRDKRASVVPPDWVIEEAERKPNFAVLWETGIKDYRMLYQTYKDLNGDIITLLRPGSALPVSGWVWTPELSEFERIRLAVDKLAKPWGFRCEMQEDWKAVAVLGDARAYDYAVILTPIRQQWDRCCLPASLVTSLSTQITNRVRGVGRVLVEVEIRSGVEIHEERPKKRIGRSSPRQ